MQDFKNIQESKIEIKKKRRKELRRKRNIAKI